MCSLEVWLEIHYNCMKFMRYKRYRRYDGWETCETQAPFAVAYDLDIGVFVSLFICVLVCLYVMDREPMLRVICHRCSVYYCVSVFVRERQRCAASYVRCSGYLQPSVHSLPQQRLILMINTINSRQNLGRMRWHQDKVPELCKYSLKSIIRLRFDLFMKSS